MRSGFSLIDLLVSIAVMVVLISILAPSLMNAQESARRVRCASNIRQVGITLQLYADDFKGRLPDAKYGANGTAATPQTNSRQSNTPSWLGDTMFVRVPRTVNASRRNTSESPVRQDSIWDGLGILSNGGYLNHPDVFYCPSHHGRHHYRDYSDRWLNNPGEIASNYQYRVPAESPYLHELTPNTTLVADGMTTKLDYNHMVGNNYLRADLGVAWFTDVNRRLYNSLPDDIGTVAPGGSGTNWKILDDHHSPLD